MTLNHKTKITSIIFSSFLLLGLIIIFFSNTLGELFARQITGYLSGTAVYSIDDTRLVLESVRFIVLGSVLSLTSAAALAVLYLKNSK